ncbi:MAG TPA: TA system VapC family ribonuclease toxin [Gemmata sp.]|nr:TA system VapC family ribonuclease toxin [Gemmata sp.]
MLLPDVNVWIALSFNAHTHHLPANSWFKTLTDESLYFCRMTQQGLLRLASNAKVFPKDAVNLTDAWKLFDRILLDPQIRFADEPPGLESRWRNFSQGGTFSPNVWSDAYLAAFAVAGGYELVTFDRGFSRYPGLTHKLLP